MIRFYSPLRTLKFLLVGNIRLAILTAYGWGCLHIWRWHNRSWLKMMKTDHRTLFVPEFMKRIASLHVQADQDISQHTFWAIDQ